MNLIYNEPNILNQLIILFNSLFIYLAFFIPFYVAKRTIVLPMNLNKSYLLINLFALAHIFVAIYFAAIIPYEIAFLYLLVAIASLKLRKKSVKWTNFSYMVLMLFVISTYNFFLYLVNNFTSNLLEMFNISNFAYENKDFFKISFGEFYQEIRVGDLTIGNHILYKKLYLFYYCLICLALSFWLFLFKKSLDKHSIIEPIKFKKKTDKLD